MAPEQILGSPVDGRSDIFAAGCILYEMVTGRRAFTGSSTTAVMYQILHEAPPMAGLFVPGIRPAIQTAITKSLAKDPAERFGSCAELGCALESCLAEELPRPAETRQPAAVPRLELGAAVARLFALMKGNPAALAAAILATLALLSPALNLAPSRPPPLPKPVGQPQIRSELPPVSQSVPMPDPVPAFRRPPRTEERRRAVGSVLRLPPRPGVSPAEPDSFSSWMVRGDLAFQQDRYGEALELYKRALQLRPADAGIRKKVATTLTLLGEPERARQYRR
jgi:tetratricopeptide (TPR) repeat protein